MRQLKDLLPKMVQSLFDATKARLAAAPFLLLNDAAKPPTFDSKLLELLGKFPLSGNPSSPANLSRNIEILYELKA